MRGHANPSDRTERGCGVALECAGRVGQGLCHVIPAGVVCAMLDSTARLPASSFLTTCARDRLVAISIRESSVTERGPSFANFRNALIS